MSKKTVKVALTYIITIGVTLAAAGLIGKYLLEKLVFEEQEDPTDHIKLERMVSDTDYVPSEADNGTLLLIFDFEKRSSASCFLVARFLVTEKKIVFLPIPSNTLAEVNGSTDTIYDFYRNGSSAAAIKAAESCLGISIDKYIKFNSSSFSTIVDIFGGGVDFDVPYNLIYSNTSTGEETVIKEGLNHLDTESLRKLLTYPNYNSGEAYRALCLGTAAADLLNNSVTGSFYLYIDYFNTVINSDIETDITAYDYESAEDAIKYAVQYSDKIAEAVIPSGTTDENNNYTLDSDFVNAVPEWLMISSQSNDNTETTLAATQEFSFPD
jgi:anionic cell wall polymer biosynthesis LytR-Cps2A-Psr (LCP) family protein